jgi:hypothetical protein
VHSALGVSPLENYEGGILGTAKKPGRDCLRAVSTRRNSGSKLRLAVKGRGSSRVFDSATVEADMDGDPNRRNKRHVRQQKS